MIRENFGCNKIFHFDMGSFLKLIKLIFKHIFWYWIARVSVEYTLIRLLVVSCRANSLSNSDTIALYLPSVYTNKIFHIFKDSNHDIAIDLPTPHRIPIARFLINFRTLRNDSNSFNFKNANVEPRMIRNSSLMNF